MQLFKLPGQQVYFLKVTACLFCFSVSWMRRAIDGLRDTLHGGVSSHWSRFFHA
ncbi:hypothetical protein ECDEC14C_2275 [Escherichia coli DEC14C]|nr:hypothetical protein ECDEC14C_2275 [Escherichia coli DEC14C]